MPIQPELNPPQAPPPMEADAGVPEPIALAEAAFQATTNLDWGEAQRLSALAQQKAREFQGPDPGFISGITEIMIAMCEGLAIQFRDGNPERFARVGQLFERTEGQLDELLRQFPVRANVPGFRTMLTSVRLQRLWAAQAAAREAGNEREARICGDRIDVFVAGLPEQEQTSWQGVVALRQFDALAARYRECAAAASAMDLARAMRLAAQIRADGEAALAKIQPMLRANVLFERLGPMLTAVLQMVQAMEGYINVLYDSIVGDVTSAHLDKLTQAEDLLLASAKQMAQGMMVVKNLSAEKAKQMEDAILPVVALVRNLKALCLESLRPRSWAPSASIRFVFIFLMTVIALAATAGVNDGISGTMLTGYSWMIALVVGLIGGFGFESLRFLPILNPLFSTFKYLAQGPAGAAPDA